MFFASFQHALGPKNTTNVTLERRLTSPTPKEALLRPHSREVAGLLGGARSFGTSADRDFGAEETPRALLVLFLKKEFDDF